MKWQIIGPDSWGVMEECDSLVEAKATVKEWEKEDKMMDDFKEGSYEIKGVVEIYEVMKDYGFMTWKKVIQDYHGDEIEALNDDNAFYSSNENRCPEKVGSFSSLEEAKVWASHKAHSLNRRVEERNTDSILRIEWLEIEKVTYEYDEEGDSFETDRVSEDVIFPDKKERYAND